jgi:hypothetical protein
MVLAQKTDMKTNGTEDPDTTHAAIWFSTKEPKMCVIKKIASSTNGAGKIRYPPVKYWNYIPVSHFVLLSIQRGSKILM